MSGPFQPLEPENAHSDKKSARLKSFVSMRSMLPNAVTLLALCTGLTSIRLAMEQRFEFAIFAMALAAFLDGVDGRVARLLKSASKFGAELDSLADFVNFGVAPAMILYLWLLHDLRSLGWIAVLIFAICTALRLARFNLSGGIKNKPAWQDNYSSGVPAPAGALCVLLPLYLQKIGLPVTQDWAFFILFYVLAIALLMVSTLPTWSGKRYGSKVPRGLALPLLVFLVLFVALLASYPFVVVTIVTAAYLMLLPVAARYYIQKANSKKA